MEGKGVGEDEEETNHLCSAEGGCVRTSPLWKTAQESLRRLTSLHCSKVKGGTPCGCFYPRVYPESQWQEPKREQASEYYSASKKDVVLLLQRWRQEGDKSKACSLDSHLRPWLSKEKVKRRLQEGCSSTVQCLPTGGGGLSPLRALLQVKSARLMIPFTGGTEGGQVKHSSGSQDPRREVWRC